MKPVSCLLLALLPFAVHADEAAIRKTFAERYAHVSITSVTPAGIPGIYEVFADGHILYTDEKGDYLLMGPLIDTRNRTNLTQQRLETLQMVKFDSLPFDKAITIVKGKGERRIAIFADPDCPFCKKLEQELADMDNLTIYLFLLPLPELHPQATEAAKNIWCATDRASAWRAYMLDGKKPEGGKNCATPVEDIAKLASELGINGTPAIILSSGRRLEGAVPAAKLESLLN